MEIALETIVERVTKEVIRELESRGVRIVTAQAPAESPHSPARTRVERPDLSLYRTPVLTERHVIKLHELTGTLIVPKGTVVSPRAVELLRDKNIVLKLE